MDDSAATPRIALSRAAAARLRMAATAWRNAAPLQQNSTQRSSMAAYQSKAAGGAGINANRCAHSLCLSVPRTAHRRIFRRAPAQRASPSAHNASPQYCVKTRGRRLASRYAHCMAAVIFQHQQTRRGDGVAKKKK